MAHASLSSIERLTDAERRQLGGPGAVAAHVRARVPDAASVEEAVREIVQAVRADGDEAVLRYTRELDTAGAPPQPLLVSAEELDRAIEALPLDLIAGLQVAIRNVALVADATIAEPHPVQLPQGQRVAAREVPVLSAAIYVPGGRAPYPSTVVMGVVTARAAGVLDVAVASPPGRDGEIDVAVLGACRLCGVERVYRMGGAQAIAALAYGTGTVTPVDVVAGPGNLYVQEAKRLLSDTVGIDGLAGPSDLVVVLGADAQPPAIELAALDMLAQAEHGAGSLVVAITPAERTCDALQAALQTELAGASREDGKPTTSPTAEAATADAASAEAAIVLIEASDAAEAISLANAIAPEHLQLIGPEVEALTAAVRAAGCLFVGAASGTAFGDYVAGSNHILPTGGSARFASGLAPRHFRRLLYEVRIGDHAAAKLAQAAIPIARAEGFEWHARSLAARLDEGSRSPKHD